MFHHGTIPWPCPPSNLLPLGAVCCQCLAADGCQPQHEGAIQANIFPCTCGPEQTCKTPTREPEEPLRHGRSLHSCRGGHAQSQSRPKWEEVFIPVGYKSTYCQERQREEKQCRSETLKRHLEKWEAEKQEVLTHSRSYIS